MNEYILFSSQNTRCEEIIWEMVQLWRRSQCQIYCPETPLRMFCYECPVRRTERTFSNEKFNHAMESLSPSARPTVSATISKLNMSPLHVCRQHAHCNANGGNSGIMMNVKNRLAYLVHPLQFQCEY